MYDFFMTNFKDVIDAQCKRVREESKQENTIQITLKMLQQKLQPELISQITELSLEQLKKLQLQLTQSH